MIKRITKRIRPHISRGQVNSFHKLRAHYWALRYRYPARGMLVFAVTGTKGKTTTCHYLASILEHAGYTVGMATTVDFRVGAEHWINESNKSVIPPRELQSLLQRMRDAHCDVCILEVTSHAIDQHRIAGIPIHYAGFTNLSHDHLDYHGTMEAYRDVKMKLFTRTRLKGVVSNVDDSVGRLVLEKTSAPKRWAVSAEPSDEEIIGATETLLADRISSSTAGTSFTLMLNDESERVNLQLPGRFNISNALVAAGLALNLGLKLSSVVQGLEALSAVPGRLERIDTRRGFSIIIDYAHTPDSLEKLYSTLRPDVRGRILAVLGATGDRDRTKRPIMGALAARFCDLLYLTDEEPYTEDPAQIIEEIAKGVPRGRSLFKPSRETTLKQGKPPILKQPLIEDPTGEGSWWWKIPDRRQAIETAILAAKMDDVVLITGMGAQTRRYVGDTTEPWNEREIIEEILRKHNLLS